MNDPSDHHPWDSTEQDLSEEVMAAEAFGPMAYLWKTAGALAGGTITGYMLYTSALLLLGLADDDFVQHLPYVILITFIGVLLASLTLRYFILARRETEGFRNLTLARVVVVVLALSFLGGFGTAAFTNYDMSLYYRSIGEDTCESLRRAGLVEAPSLEACVRAGTRCARQTTIGACSRESSSREEVALCMQHIADTKDALGITGTQLYIAGHWRTVIGLCTYQDLLSQELQ